MKDCLLFVSHVTSLVIDTGNVHSLSKVQLADFPFGPWLGFIDGLQSSMILSIPNLHQTTQALTETQRRNESIYKFPANSLKDHQEDIRYDKMT